MVEQARESWIARYGAGIFGARFFRAKVFEFERWELAADVLAAGMALSLPWSVSATTILGALWLLALIPILTGAGLKRVTMTPAGGLPVALWLLALIGMLWSIGVPAAERWNGLTSLFKFLAIPLLMFQFQRSHRAPWVIKAFLGSCGVLLILSWLLILVPALRSLRHWEGGFGVPVKDYIAQAGEFTVCIFVLAGIALQAWQRQRRGFAVALSLAALLFLANLSVIATSRTYLVVVPILLLLFILRHTARRHVAGALVAGAAFGVAAWFLVPNVQSSVLGMLSEMREFQPEGANTRAGERLEYWRKAIGFVVDAPIIGHGTGSIADQYRRVAGQSGMAAMVPENPHNQTFAVAIQLGLVGAAVMFAMWMAHAALFRGEGLVAWAGLVVVVQNIVSSLFNSHLFDFTQGWGYVIGVGVAAGALLRADGECVDAGCSNAAGSSSG